MRKQSKDDEVALTTMVKSSIIQETRAKFDSLLKRAALHQDDSTGKKNRSKEIPKANPQQNLKLNSDIEGKSRKQRSKHKLSTSTQMLIDEDNRRYSREISDEDLPIDSKVLPKSPSLNVSEDSSHSSSPNIKELFKSRKSQQSSPLDSPVMLDQDVSDAKIPKQSNLSPSKPVPLPRSRKSVREESRETTSSRFSSPDSVRTAIEAVSPLSRDEEIDDDCIERKDHAFKTSLKTSSNALELKAMKGASPSYEEIDETRFDSYPLNRQNLPSPIEEGTSIQPAVSYEEISEDNRSIKSISDKKFDSGSVKDSPPVHPTQKRKVQSGSKKSRSKTRFSLKRPPLVPKSIETDTNSDDQADYQTVSHKRSTRSSKKRGELSKQESQLHDLEQFTYEKLVGITVHRSDSLKVDNLIRHPVVRVHLIDSSTGEYLRKSQSGRSVSYHNESSEILHIQPLTTRPCNFTDPRSLIPMWEETLLFNEDIKYIVHQSVSVIILFEVLDFVTVEVASAQYQKLGSESGWYRIAWAFLKPCGANNILNIDKRVRLQLFKPRSSKSIGQQGECERCDVYQWWHRGGWVHYSSTLYVTVRSLSPPTDIPPALRSLLALQPEQGVDGNFMSTSDLHQTKFTHVKEPSDNMESNKSKAERETHAKWTRLPSQSCKIPNTRVTKLPVGQKGSFSMKFSNAGHFLAASATNQNTHSVYVYEIPSGTALVHFKGHQGLIYSVRWSPNDNLLLTASADCTACIWDVHGKKTPPLQMLPHPTFVYNAIFTKEKESPLGIFTGCCDHVVRFWKQAGSGVLNVEFLLLQELHGHDGYVGALCLGSDVLYSGDSVGRILVWKQASESQTWQYTRTITAREFRGVVLSQLILHPGEKRLLVHARDSLLRMIDINTGVAIQWFKGALTHSIYCGASISPCGGLVMSASEEGNFFVWNADTGALLAIYTALFHPASHIKATADSQTKGVLPVLGGCVDFHPYEHLAAFAIYGAFAHVVVCGYAKNSDGKDIGLQLETSTPSRTKQTKTSNLGSRTPFDSSHHISQASLMKDIYTKGVPHGTNVSKTIFHTSAKEEGGNSHKLHLSNIIKQLDYVLHLTRTPKDSSGFHDSHEQSVTENDTFPGKVVTKSKLTTDHFKVQENEISNKNLVGEICLPKSENKSDFLSMGTPVKVEYITENMQPKHRGRSRERSIPSEALIDFSLSDSSLVSSNGIQTDNVD